MSRAILETPGELDPAVRQAAAYAADVAVNKQPSGMPDELVPYVEKVARNAYKVVDADIDRLREAGYS